MDFELFENQGLEEPDLGQEDLFCDLLKEPRHSTANDSDMGEKIANDLLPNSSLVSSVSIAAVI